MTRILIVEDEPGIALGLEDDLKMEGYEVEVSLTVMPPVAPLDTPYDLVLLDVMLPVRMVLTCAASCAAAASAAHFDADREIADRESDGVGLGTDDLPSRSARGSGHESKVVRRGHEGARISITGRVGSRFRAGRAAQGRTSHGVDTS
jgi:CheY-like chemotaxis protein